MGDEPSDGGLDRDCEARGWSFDGFRKRRGEHQTWAVKWSMLPSGELDFTMERKPTVAMKFLEARDGK